MMAWLGRYGGYALIFGGWLLFSSLIPSAAGPADALRGQRVAAPSAGMPGSPAGLIPRLIASPRRAPSAIAPPAQVNVLPAPSATPHAEQAAVDSAAALAPEAEAAFEPEPVLLPPTDWIVIPRIGVDTRVIDVGVTPAGEMETAAYAAGRLSMSPQAGEHGNVVIAGHNDILGEVFRRLPELKVGDEVLLYRGDTPYRYRVEARTIVREDGATEAQRLENARWMDPTDEPVVTLISCYPYRVDTHRIIVRAVLVD